MRRPPARVLDCVAVKQLLSAEELRRTTPWRFPELLCTQTANTEVHIELILVGKKAALFSQSKAFSPQMLFVG